MPRTKRGLNRFTGNERYGSTNSSAMLYVDFTVPSECNSLGNCKVAVEFVHSWNRSYIGDVSCDLLQGDKVQLGGRPILGTAEDTEKRDMRSELDHIVKAGQYSVRCSILDSRLSCISSVSVAGKSVL